MLEYFSIATFGGLVIWRWSLDSEFNLQKLVQTVIQENLLQHRASEASKNLNISVDFSVKMKKTSHFLFVGVSRNMLNSGQAYLDEFVEDVAKLFEHLVSKSTASAEGSINPDSVEPPEGWDSAFLDLVKRSMTPKKDPTKGPRDFSQTKKGRDKNLGKSGNTNNNNNKSGDSNKSGSTKGPKKKRQWGDAALSPEEILELEANPEARGGLRAATQQGNAAALKPTTNISIDLDAEWEEMKSKEARSTSGTKSSSLSSSSWMQWLSGSKPLTADDLRPVLSKFEQELMDKNVAAPVAHEVCNQMLEKLVGTHTGMHFVTTHVRAALKEVLTRILTPKKHIDVLRGVRTANEQEGRPYTVVFVGVNGVGKSTNLSKVCCWLQQNQHKVLIAACDTFRTGAVEQLLVHAARLEAEVFENGYRTDPTQTAMAAINYARQFGHNVVLIDTAGRMQDNEPLMKALSKLVNTVKPDLVLFVGEALVGNDAVDQLSKYNQALAELNPDKPRLIDGIILSKFDTIDDKVGAAVSMVYTTGQPILFLGVGQRYEDLRRMNIDMVTNSLLNL